MGLPAPIFVRCFAVGSGEVGGDGAATFGRTVASGAVDQERVEEERVAGLHLRMAQCIAPYPLDAEEGMVHVFPIGHVVVS